MDSLNKWEECNSKKNNLFLEPCFSQKQPSETPEKKSRIQIIILTLEEFTVFPKFV